MSKLLKPRYDTWGMAKDVGAWYIISASIDKSNEGNEWFVTSLRKTLEAFAHLARPNFAHFSGIEEGASLVALQWDEQEPVDAYGRKIVEAIQGYALPMYALEVKVDLNVYARTEESGDTPVRGWFRLPSTFILRGAAEARNAYLCFEVEHTLFCPQSVEGDDNSQLYALNQPLLEQALRAWEFLCGPINEMEGRSGIYEYGFKASADD